MQSRQGDDEGDDPNSSREQLPTESPKIANGDANVEARKKNLEERVKNVTKDLRDALPAMRTPVQSARGNVFYCTLSREQKHLFQSSSRDEPRSATLYIPCRNHCLRSALNA